MMNIMHTIWTKINFKILFSFILLIILTTVFYFNFNQKDKVKQAVKSEDPLVTSLKDERYYIEKNLKRYLTYSENNLSTSEIVRNVNCNLDKTWYEDTIKADTNKENLILVNKYYYLADNYVPNDLVTLSPTYNIGTNSKMRKEVASAFMKMSDAALLDNISIKNVSGYRSYDYQVNLYNDYAKRDGKDMADKYSARAGFSEHQTGLCTDINLIDNSFEETDAFNWLSKNAYKYGFILRFPKGKENITGYQYEPWHYRYVGIKAAKIIKDENLTLEEYYAFYVEE